MSAPVLRTFLIGLSILPSLATWIYILSRTLIFSTKICLFCPLNVFSSLKLNFSPFLTFISSFHLLLSHLTLFFGKNRCTNAWFLQEPTHIGHLPTYFALFYHFLTLLVNISLLYLPVQSLVKESSSSSPFWQQKLLVCNEFLFGFTNRRYFSILC